MKFLLYLVGVLALNLTMSEAKESVVPEELKAYVSAKDDSYRWALVDTIEAGVARLYHLKLTSQTWQGISWEHDLLLFWPESSSVNNKVLLVNAGGKFDRSKIKNAGLGAMLAARVKTPVAVLLGIPNQPLFDNLKEDDLIAETFVRYLESGDASWPLLFPMVKSVVRSIDTLQAFSESELGVKMEEILLTGASKRGWTTWLTASLDPRVKAIAPMVIDMLDVPKQLDHQIKCFGKPSDQIKPYTDRGLIPVRKGEASKRLWSMVDPWTYRDSYQMPKLIVLGSNDRYWTTDALNQYWDGIPEPKWISYSPNAGHNLMEVDGQGNKVGALPLKALDATSAFVRLQFRGKSLPKLTWERLNQGAVQKIKVQSDVKPQEARLWFASSDSLDFRSSRWESKPLSLSAEGSVEVTTDFPKNAYYAYFVDYKYQVDEIGYWLSTQMSVQEPSS